MDFLSSEVGTLGGPNPLTVWRISESLKGSPWVSWLAPHLYQDLTALQWGLLSMGGSAAALAFSPQARAALMMKLANGGFSFSQAPSRAAGMIYNRPQQQPAYHVSHNNPDFYHTPMHVAPWSAPQYQVLSSVPVTPQQMTSNFSGIVQDCTGFYDQLPYQNPGGGGLQIMTMNQQNMQGMPISRMNQRDFLRITN